MSTTEHSHHLHDHDHTGEHHHGHDHADEWKGMLIGAALCGVLGIAGWLAGDRSWSIAVWLGAYLTGGWFTAQETWERLRMRQLDVHFLMLAVAVGAAAIGKWGEGSMLLFLFALSGGLEHYAMERTQKEIRSLVDNAPKTATLLDDGAEKTIPVAELEAGMRVLVKPNELFPVDAEILKGQTAVNESNLTGEAAPVEKQPGDAVLSGTLNLWGAVEINVTRPAGESALQRIITLIRDAQKNKAPSQRFTDRFGTTYTYAILGLSLVMWLVWWLGFGHPPFVSAGNDSAFYHAMTLLVVASPCALVLSIPSAILAAIAWGARRGILFRGGAAVEELAEIKVVAMDKTGTLTTGELRVETVESVPPGNEASVLQTIYSLDRLSGHPLARAITRHARRQNVEPMEVTNFQAVAGMGSIAEIGGQEVRLGRRVWVLDGLESQVPQAGETGFGVSEVWVRCGVTLGRITLRDDLREESAGLIRQLQKRGLRAMVLTGDKQSAADFLQQKLGIDDVRAGLKPEQKLAVIQELSNRGEKVAMIGDGVNDAPSLAAAHVGVAMGARGSDAALEQAEVVLMNDRLENFLAAYELSRRARRVISQNLTISIGVVVVLVGAALFERITLPVGVFGHEFSTVVVLLNSLRLLFGEAGKMTNDE